MKKIVFCVLSLAMVFVLASVALADENSEVAAEEDVEGYAAEYSDYEATSEFVLWEDWGFESLEEFLEIMGITEEEYLWWEEDERYWREWDRQRQLEREERLRQQRYEREAFIALHGGVVGKANIMIDGRFYAFESVVTGSRMHSVELVPIRLVFEALGASVAFDASEDLITVELEDGRSLRMTVGYNRAIVTEYGRERRLWLNGPVVVVDGVSFVDIVVLERLGYSVILDDIVDAAVIINREAMAEEIDRYFTAFNSLLGAQFDIMPSGDGVFLTAFEIAATFIEFDTLDGNSVSSVAADADIRTDGRNFSIDGGFLLTEDIWMRWGIGPVYSLGTGMPEFGFELIFNYSDDVLYIYAPFLHLFFYEFPIDGWVAISGLGQYIEDYITDITEEFGFFAREFFPSTATVGTSITRQLWWWSAPLGRAGVFVHDELARSVEFHKSLIGDEAFSRGQFGYTLTVTYDDLFTAANEYQQDMFLELQLRDLTEFDLNLSYTIGDGGITAASGNILFRERGWTVVTRHIAQFEISAENISISFEIHERNSYLMAVEISAATTQSDVPVSGAPPLGARIVAIEDLLPGWFRPVGGLVELGA